MLVTCGQLGLDPAALSLSGYLEALACHANPDAANDHEPGEPHDRARLSRFHRARKNPANGA